MDKMSLVILVPIAALLAGVIFATFYHKYDTSRNLFQDRNSTIEDLSGTLGNIISLQKDSGGNTVWIVLGKWKLDVNDNNNAIGKTTVDFGSNVTMEKVDGTSTDKIILSNFTLAKSEVIDEVATLDGTVSLVKVSDFHAQNMGRSNMTVPIHIVISNGRTLKIFSDSDLFRNYFGSSPIYGNIPQRD